MKSALIALLFSVACFGQAATPTSTISWLPKTFITAGSGFASPNGKFAYWSESTLLGQGTYATAAQEDTFVKGKVESCTLAGLTKPTQQFGPVTFGLTGLGGGCSSTDGTASAAASGQAFADLRFGKTNWGAVFTGMVGTTGGYKATAGVRWGK